MSAKPGYRGYAEDDGFLRRSVDCAVRRMAAVVGGRARLRVIALLAGVLALDAADRGAVGAVAVQLRQDLGVTNTQLGSLTAVSSGMGALACLPVGVLTDRVRRVRLLVVSIAVWCVAMAVSGLADSYLWLLLSRLALGAVTATAGPTLASLVGDYFPPAERGRIYGFILTGEIAGAGIGLLIGGNLARLLSWRSAFWFLALLGVALLVLIARHLHEPARGGHTLPRPGTTGPGRDDAARSAVRASGIAPDPALVLHRDPIGMSLWQAARYVLRIPTNVVLIAASAVGYFFFAGLQTFGVVYVDRQYGVSETVVTGLVPLIGVGALVGVLTGGRIADRLTRHGHLSARLVVPAIGYLATAVFFLPGLLTTSAMMALPFFFLAAASLSAANPPLDAARLDVVHYRLWGRAESVRTFLRMGAQAVAPVVFGLLADALGSGGPDSAQGLQYAFLIMLVPLLANAFILLWARRVYPRDVATATVSERLTGTDPERA
ncbi:hypothetical protein Misp01_23790 [Microtetraspora sp. NBRC 13810]|uniref:MFS transporter n=1 Tax=Microtetraspora sp. NBRC 13810 TaxID=3030990 RepID=UPI0024A1E0D8|nr:MFS transporter [Microtetraspora sp. NBRC 13810]GLW07249.1 hypothetical protein Misp01_23790 [Microtetraspora sp. NBRC 13810]